MKASILQPESPSTSDIKVVEIDESRHDVWESFLDATEQKGQATLYHRAAWDRVWSAYGLSATRLAAIEGDRVLGVLPLVQQQSVVFGNHFVSLPWFDAAGVLSSSTTVRDALIRAACKITVRRKASQLQIRQLESLGDSFAARTDKVLMRLSLPTDSEELWKSFSPKVRNQVRKAEKSGLTVQSGGLEYLDDFFQVYSINMRDLGSPSHSRRFFKAVLDAFPQQTRLSVVRMDGKVIGSGLTLANGDALEIPWASSLRAYNTHCVNHQLYWSILRQACEDGFRWFHFGRSTTGSGTYRFKRQWGAEPKTLHWYHVDPKMGDFVAAERSEESFSLARNLWTRLPVCVSRRLGPMIIRRVA